MHFTPFQSYDYKAKTEESEWRFRATHINSYIAFQEAIPHLIMCFFVTIIVDHRAFPWRHKNVFRTFCRFRGLEPSDRAFPTRLSLAP